MAVCSPTAEREFSQIIENLTDDQKINNFRVILGGVSREGYQRAFASNPSNPDGLMIEYHKLGSFRLRIWAYLKTISSPKVPFLIAFLNQFATKQG
jgi:hypothetical protein